MRTLAAVLSCAAVLVAAVPPAAADEGGSNSFDCGVDLIVIGNGLNCGLVTLDLAPGGGCTPAAGGLRCSQAYAGTAEALNWINAGSLRATISGDCTDSADAAWDLVGATTHAGCTGPVVFIPAGSCHQFRATIGVTFQGTLHPNDIFATNGVLTCVGSGPAFAPVPQLLGEKRCCLL